MSNGLDAEQGAGLGVTATAPTLHRLEFVHDEQLIPEDARSTVEYTLALNRMSRLRLGVEFGVAMKELPGVTAYVSFRMVFTLHADSENARDPEAAFRHLAARIAPMAIYPFAREALASTGARAQLPHLVLQIANVGGIFKPDEIEIPPPEDEPAADSSE